MRARQLLTAFLYGGITAAALKTLIGSSQGSGGGDSSARAWSGKALNTPFGAWIVIMIGGTLIAYGGYQWFRVYRGAFKKKLELSRLASKYRCWIIRICAFGIASRGLVFCLVGIFLIQAGLRSDAAEARGLGGALEALRTQPYGHWMFIIVALGLAAYGVYCAIKARYARFD